MNKIGVIGLGYVGTAVQKGFESIRKVVTYDIAKPCTANSIDEVIRQAKITFICVPTPMNSDGTCNVDIVRTVLQEISQVETWHKPICVLKSTITPGTTKQLAKEFSNLTLCFNPEFLTERNYIEDFIAQTNIILGYTTEPTDIRLVVDLYQERFSNSMISVTDASEAEMIKYVANTLLATKVAYLNEIYQICQKTNINYDKVITILKNDIRLGNTHWNVPGHDGKFGFGGTCFPKDINALIKFGEQNGQQVSLLRAVWEKNLEVRPEKDWELSKGRAVI